MRTPWPLIALLVAAGVVAAFHVGKMPPSIPSIRAELDVSLRQAGWLLSTMLLVVSWVPLIFISFLIARYLGVVTVAAA